MDKNLTVPEALNQLLADKKFLLNDSKALMAELEKRVAPGMELAFFRKALVDVNIGEILMVADEFGRKAHSEAESKAISQLQKHFRKDRAVFVVQTLTEAMGWNREPKFIPIIEDSSSTPQSEPPMPQFEMSTPQSESSTPQSDSSTPQSEPPMPQSEPSTPQSEPSTPQSEPSTPQSEPPSTPQFEPSTPQFEPSTPQSEPSTKSQSVAEFFRKTKREAVKKTAEDVKSNDVTIADPPLHPPQVWHENGFREKYFKFSGRLNRKRYIMRSLPIWTMSAVLNVILTLLNSMLDNATTEISDDLISFFCGVIALPIIAMIISNLSLSVRRWRDLNMSPWWILTAFIPLVNIVTFAYCLLYKKGTVGPNKYGPDPLAATVIDEDGSDKKFTEKKFAWAVSCIAVLITVISGSNMNSAEDNLASARQKLFEATAQAKRYEGIEERFGYGSLAYYAKKPIVVLNNGGASDTIPIYWKYDDDPNYKSHIVYNASFSASSSDISVVWSKDTFSPEKNYTCNVIVTSGSKKGYYTLRFTNDLNNDAFDVLVVVK